MKEARRRRFVAYFDDQFKGDRAKLIKATGLTKGRIAQLFDPDQPFGEIAARRLAEQLGLSLDYFEHDESDTEFKVTPDERAMILAYRATIGKGARDSGVSNERASPEQERRVQNLPFTSERRRPQVAPERLKRGGLSQLSGAKQAGKVAPATGKKIKKG